MDWLQVLFIIGANLGTIIALHMHQDKKITKLYEMFCDMQKEIKDIYVNFKK